MNTMLTDSLWFSPVNVIYHFRRLLEEGKLKPGTQLFKKASEAHIAAIALIGVSKLLNDTFWMQVVDDKEGSPDVRTGCYRKKIRENDFSVQDIEVVTYDEHSSDNLIDFLLKTKLASGKSYDELTTILCHIQKPTSVPPPEKLNEILIGRSTRQKYPVILIGQTNPTEEVYAMGQVYPSVDLQLTFDLIEECHRIGSKGSLRLNKSGNGKLQFRRNPDEKHYPFEKLGLI